MSYQRHILEDQNLAYGLHPNPLGMIASRICMNKLLSEIQLHGQAANNAPYTLDMNILLWLFEDIVVKCFNHSVLHFFCVWSWNNKLLGITINLLGWNCSLEMVLLKITWKLQNNKLCIWKQRVIITVIFFQFKQLEGKFQGFNRIQTCKLCINVSPGLSVVNKRCSQKFFHTLFEK